MRRARRGFSLLEVLLATATLLAAVIVLSQLAWLARRQSTAGEELANVQRECSNALNEILCGIRPLLAVEDEMLEEDPQSLLSVSIEPRERLGLALLRVTVRREETSSEETPVQFSLARWISDPDRRPALGSPSPVTPGPQPIPGDFGSP